MTIDEKIYQDIAYINNEMKSKNQNLKLGWAIKLILIFLLKKIYEIEQKLDDRIIKDIKYRQHGC